MSFKEWVRYQVTRTAFPPVEGFYRACYDRAARLAVRRLQSHPHILAIYSKTDWQQGELRPGISDIDLVFIAQEGAEESVMAAYQKCRRFAPMLEPYPLQFHPALLKQLHEQSTSNLITQEGKASWRLLAGQDYVRELQDLSPSALYRAYYQALQFWWDVFAVDVLQPPRSAWERVWVFSCAYKILAEMTRLLYALQTGEYPLSRQQGLQLGWECLDIEGQRLATRLMDWERGRFLHGDPAFVSEMLRWLLTFWEHLHKEVGATLWGQGSGPLSFSSDCPSEEMALDATEQALVGELVSAAQRDWGSRFRGAALVPSLSFGMEARVLSLFADPLCPPDATMLTAFLQTCEQVGPRMAHPLWVHLHLQHTGFRLWSPKKRAQRRQSLLTPRFCPDIYALLSQPSAVLIGECAFERTPPAWEEWRAQYLDGVWGWVIGHDALLHHPAKLSAQRFAQLWWKGLQIGILDRTLQAGRPHGAFTPRAVGRALEREGFPIPSRLWAFAEVLEGRPIEITSLIPEALTFLRAIEAYDRGCETPLLKSSLGREPRCP